MTTFPRILSLLLLALPLAASASDVRIGEVEEAYLLAEHTGDIRGVAFDGISSREPRLFVLNGFGSIDAYRVPRGGDKARDALKLLEQRDLRAAMKGEEPESPRGLTYALEGGRDVLYFLNRTAPGPGAASQLIRFPLEGGRPKVVDLSLHSYRIGSREVFGVARDGEELLVSFDASGYPNRDLRVQRGILRLTWARAGDGEPEFVEHLPDSGVAPSRGLAVMKLDEARYLWATRGSDYVYAADAPTGRGLFFFERPRSSEVNRPLWGLAFGDGALWVPEEAAGANRIHRVNATRNLDAPLEGPKLLRHLTMSIGSEPEVPAAGADDAGRVYHYYSRPYDEAQVGRQGVWPETERVVDCSEVDNVTIKDFTHDPAGDVSSRQHMQLVEYGPAPARTYSSRYEIDLWTRDYKKCVYPHRVDTDREALAGANWLADDPELYNLSDRKTYIEFFERVEAHTQKKYGVSANLENPYWAARNAVEYIQDSYYYPSRPKGMPATVDYERHHYDGNPGNLKIELSSRPYDGTQIIACSGTSVMIAGAMRHLGIPARWLGTGAEEGRSSWDENRNGLLDPEETAPCTNGHRYDQVWLGSRYGWVCFDATPTKPDLDDFDPPPPLQSQWRYMERAAGGHRKAERIVFNVGSELLRPLYRDFEYDEALVVNNDCGGDQRYNLQGRFEHPERWKLPRHRIQVKNSCFIRNVTLTGPPDETQVSWRLEGSWERDPGARVSVFLERFDERTGNARQVGRLAGPIPADAGCCVVDLSAHQDGRFRVAIRKDGDPETGGVSEAFEL